MKNSMKESPLLPLPLATSSRRQRGLQLKEIVRFITRRRLKFYIFAATLLVIVVITILHRQTVHDNRRDDVDADIHRKRARFEAQTMRTIVGKYVGPKLNWGKTAPNISDEILNSNNYDPDPNIGRDGRPVYLPSYPKDKMQMLYSINRFNLVASDKISVDRKLQDPRKMACRKKEFNLDQLPSTSIIIVFHNEAWSTLVRTVHSILNTSPKHLLAEILLVDDASNRTFLGKSLEYYMNNLSSVRSVEIKILRSAERVGLIKSRLLGVQEAKGKVLTFIDAHCEATSGWLEPLIEQVHSDPRSAACPIIDIINEDTFAYTRSFELHLGAFNWGLNFRWYPISKRELIASNVYNKQGSKAKLTELIQPFRTPVMAGGLFSIDRAYFNEIGKYDPHMDIWGGENIELSLRIWQCGGQVKIVPCSHVAHIFRKSSPYTFRPGKEVGDILYTNLARVAEVWMDEWRQFFYSVNPIVNKTLTKVGRDFALENIEDRKELRTRLNCRSFSWFLDNIWPEHFFPKDSRFFGRIKQSSSGGCLQRPLVRAGTGSQAPVGAVATFKCSPKMMPDQLFVFNNNSGFLMTDENVCLDTGSNPIPSRQIILAPCSESRRQKWEHTSESHLKHVQSGLCLDSSSPNRVHLETCDTSKESLKWTFVSERWS